MGAPLYASTRDRGGGLPTYLMVLDGEQDEALRVLLQDGLVNLLRLNCGSHSGLGLLLLEGLGGFVVVVHLLGKGLESGLVERLVLLVGGVEVDLLDGGLNLERVNGRGSLCRKLLACVLHVVDAVLEIWRSRLRVKLDVLTCLEGVSSVAIGYGCRRSEARQDSRAERVK